MNWFSRLFASRRELKRLAADVQYYRGKAEASEKESKYYQRLAFEQNQLMVDRFLTSQAKTYAVSEQAAANAAIVKTADSGKTTDELNAFLLAYKVKLEQDAIEGGVPIEDAHELFNRRTPELIAEFKENFGFNN